VSQEEQRVLGKSAIAILCYPMQEDIVRLVTHCDLTDEDVENAAKKLAYLSENILKKE